MANDPCLGMLGLARRAGKLAFGDDLVRQMCADHKARCVLVAADAGESTAKKAALYAARANVPCITLPHGKDELGAAIGKNGCAVCAVSDIGLAAAAVGKLAAQHPQYAQDAAQLAEKNERIQSRRGKKKPRDRDVQPAAEQPSEKPARKPEGKRPSRADSRPNGQRSANGKSPARAGDSSRPNGQRSANGKSPARAGDSSRPNGQRSANGKSPARAGDSSRPNGQRSANGKRPHGTGSHFTSQRKPSKNPRAKRV